MSKGKTIRVSAEVIKFLQDNRKGFETPNQVIERLIKEANQ